MGLSGAPTPGQAVAASSTSVVLASDQATIPVSVVDGADVTIGAKADAKNTATDTTAVSVMSVLKQISASVQAPPSQAVTNTGTFVVQNTPATVSTSAVTSVAGNAGNVQLLASTAGRKQAMFYNESTQILYLKLGTTASTSSYTVQLPPNGYYELPQPIYTGQIDGIWASANGNVRITELT